MWGKRKRLQDRGPVARVGIRSERRRRLLVSLIPVVLVLIPILAFIPWESFLGRDDVIPLLRPGIGIMGLAVVLGLSILAERQIPDDGEDGMSEGDIGTVDRVLADARSTEEQLRGYQLPEFDSGRMDSDLSHVSPRAVETMRIVKGPYALTWGAGTLGAIDVQTVMPAFGSDEFRLRGRVGLGYGDNASDSDSDLGLWGAGERWRFQVTGGYRTGDD